MPRYYCVQVSHPRRGWVDHPSFASTRKSEADDDAENFTRLHHIVTRVIRKPHGWTPTQTLAAKRRTFSDIAEVWCAVQEAASEPSEAAQEPPLDETQVRRHQKIQRRLETQEARRPTIYDQLLRDGLTLEEKT